MPDGRRLRVNSRYFRFILFTVISKKLYCAVYNNLSNVLEQKKKYISFSRHTCYIFLRRPYNVVLSLPVVLLYLFSVINYVDTH